MLGFQTESNKTLSYISFPSISPGGGPVATRSNIPAAYRVIVERLGTWQGGNGPALQSRPSVEDLEADEIWKITLANVWAVARETLSIQMGLR